MAAAGAEATRLLLLLLVAAAAPSRARGSGCRSGVAARGVSNSRRREWRVAEGRAEPGSRVKGRGERRRRVAWEIAPGSGSQGPGRGSNSS